MTTIRATLAGSETCTALGITVRSPSPVLTICRRLIDAGHDPDRPLHVFRKGMLALIVASIGQGARLTVKTAGNGAPMFGLHNAGRSAGAPSIAPLEQGRVISIPKMAQAATGTAP